MLTPDQKVSALLEEKRERRSEMLVYIQAQQNAILALVVFFTSAAGLYAKPELVQNASLGRTLLFALTQIVYFLSVYIMSQFSILAGNAGYVAAIETKINAIAEDKLTLYESIGSVKNAWREPAAWAFSLMGIMLSSAWGFCVFIGLTRLPSRLFLALITVETVLLLWLVAKALIEKATVSKRMAKAFLLEQTEGKERGASS